MDRQLIKRRDLAAARHDAALQMDPTRTSTAFKTELAGVVQDLTAICKEADRDDADPVEVAKTYRWLGDAYFDLGGAKESGPLSLGASQYERAEALLAQEQAPVEVAKLQFNYANTLRGLSNGTDLGLLEAAETRYEAAAKAFRANRLADLAGVVDQQLASLRPQLTIARQLGRLTTGTKAIEANLKQAGNDPGRLEQALTEAKKLFATTKGVGLEQAVDEAILAISEMALQHPERTRGGNQKLELLKQMSDAIKLMTRDLQAQRVGGKDSSSGLVLTALVQRLQADSASGKVSGERKQQLEQILQQAEQVERMPDGDLDAMQRKVAASRALVSAMLVYVNRVSAPPLPPETPSIYLRGDAMLQRLQRRLMAEKTAAMAPQDEAQAAIDLLLRSMKAGARLREFATDVNAAIRIDEEVWALAAEVQRFSLRRHLMLVEPTFQTAPAAADPRSVFVSGAAELDAAARMLHETGDIVLMPAAQGGDYAGARWNQLWSATCAAFDLGVEPGPILAQVCYELGLALAIGKPSVVIVRPGQTPPFDVALKPMAFVGRAKADAATLMEGLSHALSEPIWGGAEAGLDRGRKETLAFLLRRHGEQMKRGTLPVATRMAEERLDDAIGFRQAVDSVLGLLGAAAPLAILPAWPAAYPDSTAPPQCFHVTPFVPTWGSATRSLAEQVCTENGWQYRRGDESDEQRIIRGIWEEIAVASAVMVDITGLNPNVALELGLAHVMGKETLVVAQKANTPKWFPAIEKIQVHSYSVKQGKLVGLGEVLSEFLRKHAPR